MDMSDAMKAKARRLADAYRKKLPMDVRMNDRWRTLYLDVTARLYSPPSGLLYVQGRQGAVFPLKLNDIHAFVTVERVTEVRIRQQPIHRWVDEPIRQISPHFDLSGGTGKVSKSRPDQTVRQVVCEFYRNAIRSPADVDYFVRRWLVASQSD